MAGLDTGERIRETTGDGDCRIASYGRINSKLAEVAVPRRLFRVIVRRIAKLRLAGTRWSPT